MSDSNTWPPVDPDIERALRDAWNDGSWGKYHGSFSPQLEAALCKYHQLPSVRLCASGTVAVEIGLEALGVTAGREVILGGYDFGGNFRCIEHLGARPVLVDVDPLQGCLDPDQLDEALTDATAAIVVSHLHGGLAPMQRIMAWGVKYGVPVLEDACQAHGAMVDGRLAGTWGDVATLSFGGSKLMTAGRGGAVLTRHHEYAQRMKIYADRGNNAYPLSELQAAVLVPQLEKLDERNAMRRKSAELFRTATQSLDSMRWVGDEQSVSSRPSFYKLGWLMSARRSRDEWLERARQLGLPLDAGFPGFVKRSERRCRRIGDLLNCHAMAERLLLLHHPVLLADESELQLIGERFQELV